MQRAHQQGDHEFATGKDEAYARGKAKISAALTPEQQAILEQRGVLSPDEMHRLASKTRSAMHGETGHKAACHSDHVDDEKAQRLQEEASAAS